jgi:exopolyphosphatase/guanosine-5'-triphosphate,3'-diphosphate pyrophosphatase
MLLGTSSLKKIVAEYTKNSNDGSLDIDTFRDLLDTLVDASDQYLMEQLMINESVIPLVLPELLLIDRIVQLTNAKTLRF